MHKRSINSGRAFNYLESVNKMKILRQLFEENIAPLDYYFKPKDSGENMLKHKVNENANNDEKIGKTIELLKSRQ